MKKIVLSLMIMIGLFTITGCGNNQKLDSKETNINYQETNGNTENKKSEFEQAIDNLKNAKSVTIDYEKSKVDPDYESKSKYKLIIDYQNNKIKSNMYYSYLSLRPNSDTSANIDGYWDILLKREYEYDEKCGKWSYYDDYEVTDPIYSMLEKAKTFTDEDITKKVGNNYRVVEKESFDILVEDNKIKGIVYSPNNSQKVSISYSITFEDYNKDSVTFPNEVKNALSESEIDNVCDED